MIRRRRARVRKGILLRVLEDEVRDLRREAQGHEGNAERFLSLLGLAQRPLDPADPEFSSKVESWMDGYRSWYGAAVAPLMKEIR